MKEGREARCDDRYIVIELGIGVLAKHIRGCFRGTGTHWCYSEERNQSICSWSSLAKSKPSFEFLLLSPSSICL